MINAVKVVRATNLKNAATAPLEELGEVRTQLLKVTDSVSTLNPSTSINVSLYEIRSCIKSLKDCQSERVRLWVIERKALMRLYNGNVHLHSSIKLESFQRFLAVNFERKAALLYLKEIAVGRREQILELPIGTYSVWHFKPLERFRCFTAIGGLNQLQGKCFGVKPDPAATAHLKECWAIACELSGNNRPISAHIEKAVVEMGKRYPQYAKQKEVSSVRKWKNRALEAEKQVEILREKLAQYQK